MLGAPAVFGFPGRAGEADRRGFALDCIRGRGRGCVLYPSPRPLPQGEGEKGGAVIWLGGRRPWAGDDGSCGELTWTGRVCSLFVHEFSFS